LSASFTRVVLSDLDDTLFDHAHATHAALSELRAKTPAFAAWSLDELMRRHGVVLEHLHLEVLAGRLPLETARVERFRRLLEAADADRPSAHASDAARRYRQAYEQAWQPVAGAIAFLQSVTHAGATVVVITNNLVKEQQDKLVRCGLSGLVAALVASEEVGVQKPDVRIFGAALARVKAKAATAVMLGDAWATDIEGARAAGVRAVWLNRFGATRPDPSVQELRSLEPADEAVRVVLGRQACDRV